MSSSSSGVELSRLQSLFWWSEAGLLKGILFISAIQENFPLFVPLVILETEGKIKQDCGADSSCFWVADFSVGWMYWESYFFVQESNWVIYFWVIASLKMPFSAFCEGQFISLRFLGCNSFFLSFLSATPLTFLLQHCPKKFPVITEMVYSVLSKHVNN